MRYLILLCLLVTTGGSQSVKQKTWAALTAVSTTDWEYVQLNSGGGFPAQHTIELTVTGTPTGCTFNLDGRLGDSSAAFDLSGAIDCTVAANRMFHVVNRPIRYARGNLTALSGGTTPTVTVRYLGVP